MPVESDTYEDMAALAKYYDNDMRFWTRPERRFRFKHKDFLGMSALLTMKNRGLIEEHDEWSASTTTWTFTDYGERVCGRLENSILLECDEETLDAIEGGIERILDVPTGEFMMSDMGLRAEPVRQLSINGFVRVEEEHNNRGNVWTMTRLTREIQSECVEPQTE